MPKTASTRHGKYYKFGIVLVALVALGFWGIPKLLNSLRVPIGSFVVEAKDPGFTSMTPVMLLMDVRYATEMRFGNTEEELTVSPWEPYASSKSWHVRTGPGVRSVFAEFRNGSKRTMTTSSALDAGLIVNTFETSQQGWWAYDFEAEVPYNIFYPLTWQPRGGVEDSGYVTADGSRWGVDLPEDPDSILAFITYRGWVQAGPVDLRNANVSLYLRGDELDLQGAKVYFWVLDNESRMRWHYVAEPLVVTEGRWGEKLTITLRNDPTQWHNSWSRPPDGIPATLDEVLSGVDSYGVSFVGFPDGEAVTGRLSMDEFEIRQALN
jgi:hypothetical protein